MREIRKVAVIGSGVMGAGIAAQVANAGLPVLLFDMRRELSAGAIGRLLKTEPAAFMLPEYAGLLTPLGLDADLAELGECDWIVEAIVEKAEIKRDLYEKIAANASASAIVSSNTSTIPLADLTDAAPEEFRRRFLITHFFNPPRYMRLLEIVGGPETAAEHVEAIARFADVRLGKSIVYCRDRPGFIANRLGCFWMQASIAEAIGEGLTVEEADAAMGKSFGIPKTGVFGLADLVGIDLIPHVNASLAAALSPDDLFQTVNVPLPAVDRMIAAGLTGRKGKGGFYRINRAGGKVKEAIDLATGHYRALAPASIDAGSPLLEQDNRLGRYARSVWSRVFAYAGLLVGDAADDLAAIDDAMRLGYNWHWGPFELMDRVGPPKVVKLLRSESLPVAPIFAAAGGRPFYRDGKVLRPDGSFAAISRPEGVLLLADAKRAAPAVIANPSASLWDIGDGAACFEIGTRMNVIDADVLELLDAAIAKAEQSFRALVIYCDGPHSSAGVNLKSVVAAVKDRDWEAIARLVARGQSVFKRLKYARVPVVGTAAGLALGGGCELLLHCAAIQAHAETTMGLVETGVGLIPGWGGNGELMLRLRSMPGMPGGPMPPLARAFEIIGMASVSRSAAHARALGFLRPGDGITMNRDRLLADAKAKALTLAASWRPPVPPEFALPGSTAAVALDLQAQAIRRLEKATAHDMVIAEALIRVLTGGDADVMRPLSERQLLDLEREAFLSLADRPETLARISHTLETGKPLRN
jgi:3-hydroxyacyl-CoA dehydrogenase